MRITEGASSEMIEMERQPSRRRERLPEWILLASLVTLAFVAVPRWVVQVSWRWFPPGMQTSRWADWHYALAQLGFALLLVIGSPLRSGLRIGAFRAHWWKLLIVCSIPIALTAGVYPQLANRPFAHMSAGMWLISPLAQDMVFLGFLYGRFEQFLPGYIHRRVPIRWCVPLTAAFFAVWHLHNLETMPAGYVMFQLGYTFLGGMLAGLSRQWTGSIFYATAAHMAVNFIAWTAN